MPLDGLQSAGLFTATTTAGVATAYGIRAMYFRIINDGTTGFYLDMTDGTQVLATSSVGFLLKSGESIERHAVGINLFWNGFSVLKPAGATGSTIVRWLAMR